MEVVSGCNVKSTFNSLAEIACKTIKRLTEIFLLFIFVYGIVYFRCIDFSPTDS